MDVQKVEASCSLEVGGVVAHGKITLFEHQSGTVGFWYGHLELTPPNEGEISFDDNDGIPQFMQLQGALMMPPVSRCLIRLSDNRSGQATILPEFTMGALAQLSSGHIAAFPIVGLTQLHECVGDSTERSEASHVSHHYREEPDEFTFPYNDQQSVHYPQTNGTVVQFCEMTRDAVAAELKSRFAQCSEFRELGDLVTSYTPRSVVSGHHGGWIRLARDKSTHEHECDLFVRPKWEAIDLQIQLNGFEMPAETRQSVFNFLHHFNGLQDGMPNGAANHWAYEAVPISSWCQNCELGENENALCIYHSDTGHTLFVCKDGSVRWHILQEARHEHFADSFNEAVERFTDFLRETGYGFDFYAVTDEYEQ